MTLNYAIWWFLAPSHFLCLLLVLGCGLLLTRWKRAARIALGLGVAGLLLAGFLPLGSWFLAPLENRFPEPDLPDAVDGIIVLAGAEQPGQTARHLFPQLTDASERILTGLLLAHRYPNARLVHSGRAPVYVDRHTGRETTASSVARQILTSAGIEPARLVLEDQSTDTCDSPAQVARLVSPQPGETWLLVTSAFHMPRAIGCYRAAGWEVVPVPVDYRHTGGIPNPLAGSVTGNLSDLDLAAHEWLGLVYYRLRGKIDDLFPSPQRP